MCLYLVRLPLKDEREMSLVKEFSYEKHEEESKSELEKVIHSLEEEYDLLLR